MMDKKLIWTLAVASLAVGGIAFWGRKAMPIGATQPRYQDQTPVIEGNITGDNFAPHGGVNFIPSGKFDGPTIVLPVRYPVVPGHELSVMMAQGHSAMWRPKPQNYDWIVNPPSDVNN